MTICYYFLKDLSKPLIYLPAIHETQDLLCHFDVGKLNNGKESSFFANRIVKDPPKLLLPIQYLLILEGY